MSLWGFELLQRIISTLRHRGPNEDGCYVTDTGLLELTDHDLRERFRAKMAQVKEKLSWEERLVQQERLYHRCWPG